ncbi:MAG: helix-turn-helix domain-containing protein [Microbacterium sp.]
MSALRKDAERNRVRIIEAAARLRERGEPLQLNAVAREADVGVGTVYRHFATIAELEEVLALPRFAELQQLVAGSGASGPGRLLQDAFGVLLSDELFADVATRAELTPGVTAVRTALIAALAERLDRFRSVGQLDTPATATEILVVLCGLAHALRSAPGAVRADIVLRVVLDGLRC